MIIIGSQCCILFFKAHCRISEFMFISKMLNSFSFIVIVFSTGFDISYMPDLENKLTACPILSFVFWLTFFKLMFSFFTIVITLLKWPKISQIHCTTF